MIPRRLWVLGDSWTDPAAGTLWECGWPREVARTLGLALIASGSGGAGYVTVNAAGSSLPIQASRGAGADADAVIAWGSVNDLDQPPARVAVAAAVTYDLLRSAAPRARLIVCGPQYWAAPPPVRFYAIRDAVRDAAAAAGAVWIDPAEWMRDRPDLLDATDHPNCAGHAFIAARLTPEVLFALPPDRRPPEPSAPSGGGWETPLTVGAAAH